jgi:hypothetical protein
MLALEQIQAAPPHALEGLVNQLNSIANFSVPVAALMAIILALTAVIIKRSDCEAEDFVLGLRPSQMVRLYAGAAMMLDAEAILSSIPSLSVAYGVSLGITGFFLMMGAFLTAVIDGKVITATLSATVGASFGMLTAHLMVESDRANGYVASLHTSLQLEQVMTALFIGLAVITAALAIRLVVRDELDRHQRRATARANLARSAADKLTEDV